MKTRLKQFAVDTAVFVERLPKQMSYQVYARQLIRCSSSVGANYRAATRAKSTADFINKLKIVEEEADESIYFLELIEVLMRNKNEELIRLKTEAEEILNRCSQHKYYKKKSKS